MLGVLRLAGCRVRGGFQRIPPNPGPLLQGRCSQLQAHDPTIPRLARRQPLLTTTMTRLGRNHRRQISARIRRYWKVTAAAFVQVHKTAPARAQIPLRLTQTQLRNGLASAPRLVYISSTATGPPPLPLAPPPTTSLSRPLLLLILPPLASVRLDILAHPRPPRAPPRWCVLPVTNPLPDPTSPGPFCLLPRFPSNNHSQFPPTGNAENHHITRTYADNPTPK